MTAQFKLQPKGKPAFYSGVEIAADTKDERECALEFLKRVNPHVHANEITLESIVTTKEAA